MGDLFISKEGMEYIQNMSELSEPEVFKKEEVERLHGILTPYFTTDDLKNIFVTEDIQKELLMWGVDGLGGEDKESLFRE